MMLDEDQGLGTAHFVILLTAFVPTLTSWRVSCSASAPTDCASGLPCPTIAEVLISYLFSGPITPIAAHHLGTIHSLDLHLPGCWYSEYAYNSVIVIHPYVRLHTTTTARQCDPTSGDVGMSLDLSMAILGLA